MGQRIRIYEHGAIKTVIFINRPRVRAFWDENAAEYQVHRETSLQICFKRFSLEKNRNNVFF